MQEAYLPNFGSRDGDNNGAYDYGDEDDVMELPQSLSLFV